MPQQTTVSWAADSNWLQWDGQQIKMSIAKIPYQTQSSYLSTYMRKRKTTQTPAGSTSGYLGPHSNGESIGVALRRGRTNSKIGLVQPVQMHQTFASAHMMIHLTNVSTDTMSTSLFSSGRAQVVQSLSQSGAHSVSTSLVRRLSSGNSCRISKHRPWHPTNQRTTLARWLEKSLTAPLDLQRGATMI